MFVYRKKYKEKVEIYDEILKNKDKDLAEMKRKFGMLKNEMEAKLRIKDKSVNKLHENWAGIQHIFMIKESRLRAKLEDIDQTQKNMVNKLKEEIKRKDTAIKVNEVALRCNWETINNLKQNLSLREEDNRELTEEIGLQVKMIEDQIEQISNNAKKKNDLENELEKLNNENTMNLVMLKEYNSEIKSQKETIKELECKYATLLDQNMKKENSEENDKVKRALENNRAIMEKLVTEKEVRAVKEKQLLEKEIELAEVRQRNYFLQDQVHRLDESKTEDLSKIEVIFNQYLQLLYASYEEECKDENMTLEDSINSLGLDVKKQKTVDDLHKVGEQIASWTNKRIKTRKSKINKCKIEIAILKNKFYDKDRKNKALEEELKEVMSRLEEKDRQIEQLQQQIEEHLKSIKAEFLKNKIDDTDSTLFETSCQDNENIPESAIETIRKEIRRRNDMTRSKHDALIRIEDTFQMIAQKVIALTIVLTDAKENYEELERENNILKHSLKKKYQLMVFENVGKCTERKYEPEAKERDSKPSHVQHFTEEHAHSQQAGPSTNKLHEEHDIDGPLRKELSEMWNTSIFKVKRDEKMWLLVTKMEYLKEELQREKLFRLRTVSLFNPVLKTLGLPPEERQNCDETNTEEATSSEIAQ